MKNKNQDKRKKTLHKCIPPQLERYYTQHILELT